MLLGVLCVWRVTHLLGAEDGPWDLLARLRRSIERVAPTRLFQCFYCLSLWVAALFGWAMAEAWRDRALLWLASSGGAILLQRLTTASDTEIVPVPYREEEVPHARMLRTEPFSGPERAAGNRGSDGATDGARQP
jgi:hypothetical protein